MVDVDGKCIRVADASSFKNNDDGSEAVSPSLETVAAEGFLVIVAGADTSAAVMSSVLYLLMKNPDAYKKVQDEVDRYYPAGENALDCTHHPNMPFMEAVMYVASYSVFVCALLIHLFLIQQ